MRGILIYDAVGKARNEWFIARLIESAKSRGCDLELIVTGNADDVCIGADFAIVRTINPKINESLEARGIPCFNSAKVARIANDKWQTYLFARELGLSVMDTLKPKDARITPDAFDLPFVIKTVDGHGGSEVFLIDNEEKCKELLSKFDNDRLIVQKLCSEPGIDMRVYMLGAEVLAAVKRTSLSDFRSNFSLGGQAEIVSVPEDVKAVLATVTEALGADFVGVDFIRHGGKWILNEIEDVVGTRMLYSLTDIDAADEYVAYILNKINSKA